MYERAPCALMAIAASGIIERVNRTLGSWLGYSAEELVGKRRLQDLLTMGCKIFHQTHWMPLLQIQGSVAEVQLEMVHRDGHVVPMLVNAIQHVGESKTYYELALFVANDRRTYERELLHARKQAEQLLERERAAQHALMQAAEQRALLAEQLIGIVSHDLRTPLNAVALGASLLAASEVSPAQVRLVDRIASAAKRSNRLIEDLLDFTQARIGGGLRLALRQVDPRALVAECVEELRLTWPGRMLEHQHSGEGTCFVDGDRLAQVITNLANNAMTYGSPERPVTIRVTLAAQLLQVEVHNSGPTIPDQLLPHIFEPMRRGEQQVRLGSRSVGLGLYIVQQVAAAHGGSVEVHSTSADGTTFRVQLPFAAPSAQSTNV